MDLYDFTADQYTKETLQAPEHCIYRQDPRFVKSLGSLMTNSIFNGYCMTYKNFYCGVEGDSSGGRLGSLGAGTVAKIL
ncbi:hypothetical protein G6514_009737, partial [Epicoccum nigrum]